MTAVDERPNLATPQDPNLDLGFGSVVARESRKRLLNRDGTFNVRRVGLGFWQSHSAYHYFLPLTWPQFLGYPGSASVVLNPLFPSLYVPAGETLGGFAPLLSFASTP